VPAAIHDHLRALACAPAEQLDRLTDAAWRANDADALELCRLRIAQLHGDQLALARRTAGVSIDDAKLGALENWWTSDLFSPSDQARLAFTEQFVLSVSSTIDSDIDALLVDGEADSVYNFVTAIYVIDLSIRVDLVTRQIFASPFSEVSS